MLTRGVNVSEQSLHRRKAHCAGQVGQTALEFSGHPPFSWTSHHVTACVLLLQKRQAVTYSGPETSRHLFAEGCIDGVSEGRRLQESIGFILTTHHSHWSGFISKCSTSYRVMPFVISFFILPYIGMSLPSFLSFPFSSLFFFLPHNFHIYIFFPPIFVCSFVSTSFSSIYVYPSWFSLLCYLCSFPFFLAYIIISFKSKMLRDKVINILIIGGISICVKSM